MVDAQPPTLPPEVAENAAERLVRMRVPDTQDPTDTTRVRTRWLLDAACAHLRRQERHVVAEVEELTPRSLTNLEAARSYLDLACERLEWLHDPEFADRVRQRIEQTLARIRPVPRRVWLGPIVEDPDDWHKQWRWVYDDAEQECAFKEARPDRDGRWTRPTPLSEDQQLWLNTQRVKQETAMLADLRYWLQRLARDVWPTTPPRPSHDAGESPPRSECWGGPWITHRQAVRILRFTSSHTGGLASNSGLRKAIERAAPGDPLAVLQDKTQRIAKCPKSGRLRLEAVVHVARTLGVEPDLTA